MKKHLLKTILIVASLFVLVSCVSSPIMFTLDEFEVQDTTSILTGYVEYGLGFYMPSNSSVLDIYLENNLGEEISHSTIRNIQKFPLAFSIRYDKNDVSDSSYYRLTSTFTTDGTSYISDTVVLNSLSNTSSIILSLD